MSYETFDHTADLGLRVCAADLPTLLTEAARGLFSIIVADLSTVEHRLEIPFRVEGTSPDLLLFDWLSTLLFTFETQHLLLSDFKICLDSTGLSATARGEPIDIDRHSLEHEVKAITYHALRVEQQPSGWFAEFILDI